MLEWKDSDCGWLPVHSEKRNEKGEYVNLIFDTELEAQKVQQDRFFGLCNYRIRKIAK